MGGGRIALDALSAHCLNHLVGEAPLFIRAALLGPLKGSSQNRVQSREASRLSVGRGRRGSRGGVDCLRNVKRELRVSGVLPEGRRERGVNIGEGDGRVHRGIASRHIPRVKPTTT